MRIIKEAHTGTTKFVVAPDYLEISGEDEVSGVKASFVINRDEAVQIADWLFNELNQFGTSALVRKAEIVASGPQPDNTKPKKKEDKCDYIPSPRSATQTVELKLGDPNLAYQSQRGRTPGDGDAGIVDLGKLHGSVTVA